MRLSPMFLVQLLFLRIRRGRGSVLSRLKPRQRISFLGPALQKATGKAILDPKRESSGSSPVDEDPTRYRGAM